jgi:hypothetical protein
VKSTRRHDLQENELARSIGDAAQFLRQYANWLVGGLVAIIVVALLVWYGINQRNVTRQKQWQRYFALSNSVQYQGRMTGPEAQAMPARVRQDLAELAGETSQQSLAAWTNIQIGYSAFDELTRRRTELGAVDVDLLAGDTRQAYERVISNYPAQIAPVAEAHLGLGKLNETLSNFDAARQQYEAVVAMEGKIEPLTVSQARARLADMGKYSEPVVFPASAPASELAQGPLQEMVTSQPATAPAASGPAATAPVSQK